MSESRTEFPSRSNGPRHSEPRGGGTAGDRKPGLEGVVALDSELGYIDGAKGELIYRGYDISQLTRLTSFEEVAFLLWNGHLPNRRERSEEHTSELQSRGHLVC